MKFRRQMMLALFAAGVATAQPGPMPAPTVLKGPEDWRFERMPTPPGFAPDIKLRGYEEARFAPGMFDTTSANYFTYVLIISADGTPSLDSAALKDFLQKYYRGLSAGLGKQKGLAVDPAQMNAEVAALAGEKNRYTAKVTFIDTFTDGRKTSLNIEARVTPRPAAKKTGLILLISPQPKDHAVWQKLREIDGKIEFTGSE